MASVAGAAAAAPPVLEVPVDCTIGEVCFIQNYVDHDPGPGRLDHACGRLSYDGHQGTDFRVRDYVDMARGYAVVAAADGVVTAARDGMADVSIRETGADAVRSREAGNGVLIDHGDGWETQYSHLRHGSVQVAPGDRVAAADPLGLIGLSGNTEFPHVEFTVRHEGDAVDPFAGPDFAGGCADERAPLWSDEALAELTYRRTGLLIAGFADQAPEADGVRRGAFRLGSDAHDPEALVFWVDLFGAEAGDLQRFRIWAPDDSLFLDQESRLDESNVSWFTFGGRRRPPDGWPPGLWRARYELLRGDERVVSEERTIRLGGG